MDILAIFPSLHIATLFRKTITEDAVSRVFENAPTDIVKKYLREYGITLSIKVDIIMSAKQLSMANHVLGKIGYGKVEEG